MAVAVLPLVRGPVKLASRTRSEDNTYATASNRLERALILRLTIETRQKSCCCCVCGQLLLGRPALLWQTQNAHTKQHCPMCKENTCFVAIATLMHVSMPVVHARAALHWHAGCTGCCGFGLMSVSCLHMVAATCSQAGLARQDQTPSAAAAVAVPALAPAT